MTIRTLAILAMSLLLTVVDTAELAAQRLERPFVQLSPPVPEPLTLSAAERTDHRVDGAVIGGLALAVFGGWIGYEACHNGPQPTDFSSGECRDETLIVGLVGGAVGAVIGYFVGKGMPKH